MTTGPRRKKTIAGLRTLQEAGKIRHYGVSNYTAPMLAACQQHGQLATNQVGYHLFDRRAEKAVLPYCRAEGIGFMAYGTLAFGLLMRRFPQLKPALSIGIGAAAAMPSVCRSSNANIFSKRCAWWTS